MDDKTVLTSKAENVDKKKLIVQDEDGYFKVSFGKLNAYNNNGIFYRVDDIDRVLSGSSIVGKRIDNGILRSEYKHPDVSGLSNIELQRRTIYIDIDRVCVHVKKLEAVKTGNIDKTFNLPEYHVYGWVKPEGPFAKYLKEVLNNPYSNAAFSIRSLVKQQKVMGIMVRDVFLISTWDYVHEPGVKISTQWNAAGVESQSLDIVIEDDADIDALITAYESDMEGITCKDGRCVIDALHNILDKKNKTMLDW